MVEQKFHFVKGYFNYRIVRKCPNNHFELVCKIPVFCSDAKEFTEKITNFLNN
jgi:hypothetical protein